MIQLPTVHAGHTIDHAMQTIQQDGRGIALVVDADGRLTATVTDGDVRRAILAGIWTRSQVCNLLASKGNAAPVAAPDGTPSATLEAMMRDRGIHAIPLLDADGRPVGLATLDGVTAEPDDVQAVLMAGGRGLRLWPLTENCPKPMLPVNGKPLLEHTVERLRDAGIRRIHLTVGYLPDRIIGHFGSGQDWDVEVRYVRESEPLGTAGSLGLMDPADGPLLVQNADVMSGIDYRALLAYHRDRAADLTMAVRWQSWDISFGVVKCKGDMVVALEEKPTAGVLINAGVYVVSPEVQRCLPAQPLTMPQIASALLAMGRPVAAFPMVESESWVDIGSPSEYARAQEVTG